MLHDFRFAFRQLVKARAFTAAAVAVLALGIGANTAIFSLMNTLLFQPPHYPKASEVMQVFSQDKKNPKTYRGFSYPTYLDIREQNSVFLEVMAHNLAMVGLGDKGSTRRAFTDVVSSNYFSVMGVMPMQGRAFRTEEETPGRNSAVAIVSYNYWKREGFNPAMLGSTITIDSRPFTVIGILPQGFTGTTQVFAPEIFLPLGVYDQVANDFETENKGSLKDRGGKQLMIVGRLKPGMTAVAAAPELKGLAASLEQAYPVEQKDQTFTIDRLSRFSLSTSPSSGGKITRLAPLLFGMSGVVLLVACLNLANMLLARGAARRKEIAIRLALGGSRGRIVRQLLVEGFVLALAGGLFGLLLGLWSSDLLVASLGKKLPIDMVWQSGLSAPVLTATFVFCLLGTLAFALGPALKLSKSVVIGDLKGHAGEDIVVRRWKFWPRNPLVVVQIAFSLALLTAAALFIRGAGKAAAVEPGCRRNQITFWKSTRVSRLTIRRARGIYIERLRSGSPLCPGSSAPAFPPRSRSGWSHSTNRSNAAERSGAGCKAGHRGGRPRVYRELQQCGSGLFQNCRPAAAARPPFQPGGSDASNFAAGGHHRRSAGEEALA